MINIGGWLFLCNGSSPGQCRVISGIHDFHPLDAIRFLISVESSSQPRQPEAPQTLPSGPWAQEWSPVGSIGLCHQVTFHGSFVPVDTLCPPASQFMKVKLPCNNTRALISTSMIYQGEGRSLYGFIFTEFLSSLGLFSCME